MAHEDRADRDTSARSCRFPTRFTVLINNTEDNA